MANCSIRAKPRLEMRDANGGVAHRRLSVEVDADLRCRRESMSATLWSSSARYGGTVECRQWYVSTASLNSIHCGTHSQCRSQSSGLVASYSLAEKTSRVVAFSTD